MLHALKTEVDYFDLIEAGDKTFEVRKDDRPFKVDDEIVLQEWDATAKKYTGKEWRGTIAYILRDERFCKKGYCVLSIKPKEEVEDQE